MSGDGDAATDEGAAARGAKEDAGIVQVRRLEVVDDKGRVRVVLGSLGPGAGHGVALVDDRGRSRLLASLDEGGPVAVFDQGGNIRLELGVHDHTTDAEHVGPYVFLNDADGRPVAGVRVNADGSVTLIGALLPRAADIAEDGGDLQPP